MAKQGIVVPYDDAGFPSIASSTVSLTATGAVKTSPGRLLKLIVTTVIGAGAVSIFDNTAASGTLLFVIPAAAAVGTVYDVNLPAANGIFASFASTGTVTFGYA